MELRRAPILQVPSASSRSNPVKDPESLFVSKYWLSDAAAVDETSLHDCPISEVHFLAVRWVLRNCVLGNLGAAFVQQE